MGVSDEELVQRYLNGQQESFLELIERYETKVFNTALYLTDDVAEAEIVLTEVFVELSKQLRSDSGKTPLFAWLTQFTLDRAIQHLITSPERRDRLPESIVLKDPFDEHREKFAERNPHLRSALTEALNTLPPEAKLAFILRDIQATPMQTIADMLDCTVFEVRARLREARACLNTHLERILPVAA